MSTTGKVPERLAALQHGFAGHIRNPETEPAPADIEDRRMAIYRELFFNNLRKFLAGNFPVLRRLHDDDRWDALIRDFFVEHRAHTPLFPEVPREFLAYLQDERGQREGDLPFMLELAHWEWVELGLEIDETDLDDIACDPEGDLLTGVPVVSPVAWVMSYHYPVHQIGPDFLPTEPPPEPTHLLAYRNSEERVKFMQVNAVTVLLLQLLKDDEQATGQMALKRVAERLGRNDPETIIGHGAALLNDLRERGVILGTRP